MSEWWNDEVGRAVAVNRRAFEEWLHRRDIVTYDRYWAQRGAVKRAIKSRKKNHSGDGKSDWEMISRVKNDNGKILRYGVEGRRRWQSILSTS